MEIRDVAKLCALLILLVAAGFTAGCSSPSQAQSTSPSSSQVLVVNTSAQPVPVVAQGTTNVNATVSNSVNALVTNPMDTNGNPVPLVTDAATYAAHHDFFNQAVCKFNGVDCSATQAFFIRANRTLVIESVTGFCNNMNAGDSIQQVGIFESAPFANGILIPGGTATGTAALTFAQATKAYFPSGANGQTASFSVVTANGATEGPNAQCAAFIKRLPGSVADPTTPKCRSLCYRKMTFAESHLAIIPFLGTWPPGPCDPAQNPFVNYRGLFY